MDKTLKFRIITLSDRAYKGIYEDKSGPKIKERLKDHYAGKEPDITVEVIPDEKDMLIKALEKAVREGADSIFTTGGTGVGPRDITPEVIMEFADKLLPGIMDHIRLKYGAEKPSVLLSRSVAGVKNKSLVFALPGSTKAVNEYLTEIHKILMHSFLMLHGIDSH